MTWLIALCCVAIAPTTFAQMASHSASCKIDTTKPSEADRAFHRGDFIKSAALYAESLKANSADERSHELWIDSLIGRNKLDEATKNTEAWTLAEPKSARAIATASDLRQAEGDWLEAYALALKALQVDPCIPDIYEAMADYETLAGYHATARKHLSIAHQLAPNDENIQFAWIESLDRESSLEQYKSYLATSAAISDVGRKKAAHTLEMLNASSQNRCELAAVKGTAVIPMVPIQDNSSHGVDDYGLEIAFNGHKKILRIDTTANGFLLTHSAAAGLGLVKVDTSRIRGLGEDAAASTTRSTSAHVQVGGLEFKNCTVSELNNFGVMGGDQMGMGERLDSGDGFVGTNIFDRYLVTLDYIKHEIRLEPLPLSPNVASIPTDALGGMNDPGSVVIDRFVPTSMKVWTNIYRNKQNLTIPTRINAQPPRLFILSTGNVSNIIDKKSAENVSKVRESINRFQGFSGTVMKVGETGPLTIDFANLRLPVDSMDAVDLSKNFPGISGFLGYPTLSQLIMHIDYRDNLILLEAPLAHRQ